MKTLIVLLAFACVFRIGDAAISAWTEPVISGADGSAAAATSIAEDLPAGSTGVTIQATGAGTVTYAITSQTTSGKLSIDTDSGLLTLESGQSFDFETATTYEVVITATDASDSSTGTATVTLSITDVGPVFAATQYVATVADGSTEDTAVVTVTAIAQDGGTLTYSITDGDADSHFKIDSSTGAITVNTGATLNAETLGGYTLTVTVNDGNTDDTATVWIAVKDCSSGAGAFVASLLTVFIAMMVLLL